MQHQSPVLHLSDASALRAEQTQPITRFSELPEQRAADCQSQLSALPPSSLTGALGCGGGWGAAGSGS